MRHRARLLTVGLALIGCEVDQPPAAVQPPLPRSTASAPSASATASASTDSAAACVAPSKAASSKLDARDAAALKRCVPLPRIGKDGAMRCGLGGEDADLAMQAIDGGVLPLDAATLAHARAIAVKGKKLGRRPRVFGLVGDSMTVSWAFLRSFTKGYEEHVTVAPELSAALSTKVGGANGSIIDFYRGVQAQQLEGAWRDSFNAIRAAKIGARAVWALQGGREAPLEKMVRELSPAVAVVLYGGNDAAFRPASVDELANEFERHLGAVLDALEAKGIVPIMNTLARHNHMPGMDDCSSGDELSNWRVAVHTNALSARVVDMACRRKLPLIDLRQALDAAPNHGLGADGVHPTAHARGGGQLTERGFRCGYNIRNYVTLRMLKQIKEQVLDPLE